MPTNFKRITFTVTPDIKDQLSRAKRDVFYDRTQSDMVRKLVSAGLETLKNKTVKDKPNN